MKKTLISNDASAPKGYELVAKHSHHFDLKRRQLFRIAGKGIAVVPAQEDSSRDGRAFDRLMPSAIGTWLHIDKDGAITVYTGKVEVGQNIRTSLSQLVAEELRVPIESVRLVMGDTDLTPYDIGTFSSRTTPVMGTQLRKVAAATRELLLDLAAEAWDVERGSLTVADGKVTCSKTNQSSYFGQLTKDQELMKIISGDKAVTPAKHWTTAGKSVPKVNGLAHVTGRHKYTSDMTQPGMLYGRVLRPEAFHATLARIDTSEAEAMAGVTVVRDKDFIGVTASDELTAARAIVAIEATWNTTAQLSQLGIVDYFKENPIQVQGLGGPFEYTAGSVEQALAAADKTLEQTYVVDFIAHAPLEPRAALAQWMNGKLTVWTGTQRPFEVRSELARAFRVAKHQVRVIVPDTGSCYGGKHTGEAAIEAARLAQAVGKPVKIVWTRQEEFTWAYFRAAGVIDITSGVRNDGMVTAWKFHNYNAGSNSIRTLYQVPNQHIEFHPARSPLRQGAYRALAATANHFARETHIDELARMLGTDALEFRHQHLADSRLRAVFDAASNAFGWGKAKPSPNHGFGIAGGSEKGSYIATCAEVYVNRSSGQVEVVHVVEAFECGAIINPDQLKNQIEGSIMQGLGGALFETIEFENGKILNPCFSRYRVPRFSDVPSIEVVLLDRKDLPPAGAGETPIVGIAPAIGNAIFDATGIRLRSLPLVPNNLQM